MDGNDPLAVLDAVGTAAERARQGEGPTLIEGLTYRWKGHSKSDRQLYRTRDEVKAWQAKDPIPRFAALLEKQGLIGPDDNEHDKLAAEAAIAAAVEFAEASPDPDVATIMDGVYA